MPKKKDFKLPGHKVATTSEEISKKLDGVDQTLQDVKAMLLEGKRPKDIAEQVGTSIGFVRNVMTAANLEMRDLIAARQYHWRRGKFQEHFGTWRFQFRCTLPNEIKSWRVASIEPGKIVIETAEIEK